MHLTLLDKTDPHWRSTITTLYEKLGFPNNPHLLPPQFAQVTIPKIGGKLALLQSNSETSSEISSETIGAGFLLPRTYSSPENEQATPNGKHIYTLRYHPIINSAIDPQTLAPLIESQLENAQVILFDAHAPQTFPTKEYPSETLSSKSLAEDPITIAHPTAAEAQEIRQVHQQIWRNPPGYLYPAEMHCAEYRSGTSLIARTSTDPKSKTEHASTQKVDTQVIGFLLGFYRFAGSQLPADWHERLNGGWRLESQSMGILPDFRQRRLGHRLKLAQAAHARHQGIQIIHWTFDPLQFRNAALNLGLLRSIAFDFHADLYPFRNELNQVAASRFSATWLINSERVQPIRGQQAKIIDLKNDDRTVRINHGLKRIVEETTAPQIAIEIPADWSAIQLETLDLAQQWRSTTDKIFEQFIGCNPNQYVVTDVAVDGPNRYLIAKRASDQLWQHLSSTQ